MCYLHHFAFQMRNDNSYLHSFTPPKRGVLIEKRCKKNIILYIVRQFTNFNTTNYFSSNCSLGFLTKRSSFGGTGSAITETYLSFSSNL